MWTVDAAGGADFSSIQDAIYASADGDTVEVAAGTYSEALNFCGREIAVIGTDGAEATVITPPYGVSAVSFLYGEGPQAVLSGFTITGADTHDVEAEDPPGGGLYILYSCPTLTDLIIEDNYAYFGGGIKMKWNSHPKLERVVIRDNVAMGCGGGLYLCECDPTLVDVEIRDNVAEMMNGGGVIIGKGSTPRFHRVLIEGNTAATDGGGVYALGVVPDYEVDVLFSNVTIDGNISDLAGTGAHGANVYLHLGVRATFINSIVAHAYNGEGIFAYDFDPLAPHSLTLSHSDFFSNSGGDVISGEHGELLGTLATDGVIQEDPLFVELEEDYQLQSVAEGYEQDSPCIDSGYDDEAWNDPDGSRSDMGAHGGPEEIFHDTSKCAGSGSGDPCEGDDDVSDDDDSSAVDDGDDDSTGLVYKDCVCDSGGRSSAPGWLLALAAWGWVRGRAGKT